MKGLLRHFGAQVPAFAQEHCFRAGLFRTACRVEDSPSSFLLFLLVLLLLLLLLLLLGKASSAAAAMRSPKATSAKKGEGKEARREAQFLARLAEDGDVQVMNGGREEKDLP